MQTLNVIPLFEEMDATMAERFARSCFWKDYDEFELVIDVEDETTDVRFLLSGSVRIIHRIAVGKEVILGEMTAGDFFGEISAIDSETRSANATNADPNQNLHHATKNIYGNFGKGFRGQLQSIESINPTHSLSEFTTCGTFLPASKTSPLFRIVTPIQTSHGP